MRSQIKILFLCDEIEAITGGTEGNILTLMRNLPSDHYSVSLAVLRIRTPLPKEFSNFEVLNLNLTSFGNIPRLVGSIKGLRRWILKNKVSILQVYFPDSQFLSCLSFLKRIDCKLVIARRSLNYHSNFLLVQRNKLLARYPDFYLVNSYSIKKEIMEKERVPEKNIQVIYNPIDTSRMEKGFSMVWDKNKLGFDSNHPVIGIVANIRPVKDYATFFKAAALVAHHCPKAKFVIVGREDPIYWQSLMQAGFLAPLADRCIILKQIDNPYCIVPIFDVGVLTSISEGLSNSLIEYAVAGVPAVATAAGGNSEVILDSVTGFLVPVGSYESLADKIIYLLNNREKRIEMGRQAQKVIREKFNHFKIMQDYNRFYQSILNENG